MLAVASVHVPAGSHATLHAARRQDDAGTGHHGHDIDEPRADARNHSATPKHSQPAPQPASARARDQPTHQAWAPPSPVPPTFSSRGRGLEHQHPNALACLATSRNEPAHGLQNLTRTFRHQQLSHMRRRTHADAVGGRRARDGLVEARAARRDAGCTAQMILEETWSPIHGANCTQPPNEVLCIWGYKNKGIWHMGRLDQKAFLSRCICMRPRLVLLDIKLKRFFRRVEGCKENK